MLAEAQEARAAGPDGPARARSSAGVEAPSRSIGRVGVIRLALTQFRNYRQLRLALAADPVVLTGPNGAGKTNLLEALSFLAPGRGLRRARLGELERRRETTPADAAAGEARSWAVAARVATVSGPLRIGTGRDGGAGERRVVRIDGEPVRGQDALGERLGILWLTPSMDHLFVEGPGGRRRFLDRLVLGLDPGHAGRIAAYEQALRERSRLLRTSALKGGRADPAWLGALEEVMARHGVAAAAARRDLVQRLDGACAAAEGPFPSAQLRLVGTVEGWLDAMPALAAEERLADALARSRREDALAGGAAIGPHRSDLALALRDNGIAAELASTGEQKALLLSIVLAQAGLQRAIRGEPPLLLLDEVAAHLDATRRAALFAALVRLDGQVWLTGTEADLFAPLKSAAQFLSVRDGAIDS